MDMLPRYSLPAGSGEVFRERLAVSADHGAIGVDTHPLLVRNANKLKRPVVEKRALNAAATSIYADTQKDAVRLHRDTLIQVSEQGSHAGPFFCSGMILLKTDYRRLPKKSPGGLADKKGRMAIVVFSFNIMSPVVVRFSLVVNMADLRRIIAIGFERVCTRVFGLI